MDDELCIVVYGAVAVLRYHEHLTLKTTPVFAALPASAAIVPLPLPFLPCISLYTFTAGPIFWTWCLGGCADYYTR
ncbi:MAG: hypothetical protein OES09_14300, partial [Gammaproteobacteria bacterium]|nr:hypothetical protein [Gammaproteobacteria bacterium]